MLPSVVDYGGAGAPTDVLTNTLSGSAPSISIVLLTTVFGTPVT